MGVGTVHQTSVAAAPQSMTGAVHQTAAPRDPVAHTSEVHQTTAEELRAGVGSEVHQTTAEELKAGGVGTVHQTVSQDAAGQPPVITDAFVVQRDVAQTFLVDCTAVVYHPPGDDVKIEPVEYQLGGVDGPWLPCTPQTFDRKHDDGFQPGIPTFPPGVPLNFVWQAFFDLPEGTFDDVFVRITVEDNPTATVIVGPVTISTVEPTTAEENFAKSLARRGQLARTALDFLGCGLVIPFERASQDFRNDCDVEVIKSCVRQILGTRAAVGNFMGDLPWRPDFGSKHWILRHRNNDPTLRAQAVAFVHEALSWEPRVEVTGVDVLRGLPTDEELRRLRLRVNYRIIGENVDENRVLLPEFTEEVSIV